MHIKLKFTSLLVVTAAAMPFFLSCSNPVDSSEHPACGPGIIVPGICIDGVTLGDSRERVDDLLGEPTGIGWADGLYRAWRTYWYKPPGSEGLGLSILFIEEEDLSWGPVDHLMVHEPYEGKTPEGIGIGSTLEEVRLAYGDPDFVAKGELTNTVSNLYCINSKRFLISTQDGIIQIISIYPFISIEEHQTIYSCE